MVRTAWVCLALSVLCVGVDQVYALFGHGVRSLAMTYMALIPLLGGALPFLLLFFAYRGVPAGLYRIGLNLYFGGLAALTVGAFFQGILEIAGSSSAFLPFFYLGGGGMAMTGGVLLIVGLRRGKAPRAKRDSSSPERRPTI